MEKREKQLQEQLAGVLALLNPERRKAGESFTRKLESELQGLGFSQYVRVSADWSEVALFPGCVEDRVRLLWSPNPGQQPQPLDKIASGGELSRFMLAVVSVQEHDEEATLIFDEVDAGVGGLTLNKVGDGSKLLPTPPDAFDYALATACLRAFRHFRVTKQVKDGRHLQQDPSG